MPIYNFLYAKWYNAFVSDEFMETFKISVYVVLTLGIIIIFIWAMFFTRKGREISKKCCLKCFCHKKPNCLKFKSRVQTKEIEIFEKNRPSDASADSEANFTRKPSIRK